MLHHISCDDLFKKVLDPRLLQVTDHRGTSGRGCQSDPPSLFLQPVQQFPHSLLDGKTVFFQILPKPVGCLPAKHFVVKICTIGFQDDLSAVIGIPPDTLWKNDLHIRKSPSVCHLDPAVLTQSLRVEQDSVHIKYDCLCHPFLSFTLSR